MKKERDDEESGRPVQLDPEKDQPGQGRPGQQPGNPPQDPQPAK